MEEALSTSYFGDYLRSLEQQDEEYLCSFKGIYHCYALNMKINGDNHHLEEVNRIIMPASALDLLVDSSVSYPMMFKIRNMANGRVSHSGVEEFTAEEGSIYLPKLVMDNLKLLEGDPVILENVDLEKGTYMKLQPHSTEFLKISDHKEVLERQLKSFTCVTKGNMIVINHEGKRFYVDVVETKPNDAASLIDTDCEVDFACPLDYVEPVQPKKLPVMRQFVRPKVQKEPLKEEDLKFKPFVGVSRRLTSDSDKDSSSKSTSTTDLKDFQRPINVAVAEKLAKSMQYNSRERRLLLSQELGQKEDPKLKEEMVEEEADGTLKFVRKRKEKNVITDVNDEAEAQPQLRKKRKLVRPRIVNN